MFYENLLISPDLPAYLHVGSVNIPSAYLCYKECHSAVQDTQQTDQPCHHQNHWFRCLMISDLKQASVRHLFFALEFSSCYLI